MKRIKIRVTAEIEYDPDKYNISGVGIGFFNGDGTDLQEVIEGEAEVIDYIDTEVQSWESVNES